MSYIITVEEQRAENIVRNIRRIIEELRDESDIDELKIKLEKLHEWSMCRKYNDNYEDLLHLLINGDLYESITTKKSKVRTILAQS